MADGTIPEVYVGINDTAFRAGVDKAATHMKTVVATAETEIRDAVAKQGVDVEGMRAKAGVAEQELDTLMGQYDMATSDFDTLSTNIETAVSEHYAKIDAVRAEVETVPPVVDAMVADMRIDLAAVGNDVVIVQEEVKAAVADAKTELALLKLETKVKLNTIYRSISMAKTAGFQLLDFMGIAVDTTLKGVIDTGFATGQFLLSMKAATTAEALANPFAWLRVAALATSYFLTVANTIKMVVERQRIAADFEKVNKKSAAPQTIRKTVRI